MAELLDEAGNPTGVYYNPADWVIEPQPSDTRPNRGDMVRGLVDRRLRRDAEQEQFHERLEFAHDRYMRYCAEFGEVPRRSWLAKAELPAWWDAPSFGRVGEGIIATCLRLEREKLAMERKWQEAMKLYTIGRDRG